MQHIYIGNNINCDVYLAHCLLRLMYTHLHACILATDLQGIRIDLDFIYMVSNRGRKKERKKEIQSESSEWAGE